MPLPSQSDDFPQWYLECVSQAGLAEDSGVRGCIVFKPYGYAIWELMQKDLDRRIKELGAENAYFPLFIPESVMKKEADHIQGFAPECAVVTHGGGKELTEKLYVRPTSETIIYDTFSRWITSHRDLPLRINQWANVVRWEMRTRPFLRTTEFLWQEGHTAHATETEADEMCQAALRMYEEFDRETLAIPVVTGRKPDHDKFAGAEYTLATEALARDGKAIQAGTSHMLGQGFSQAYGIRFTDETGAQVLPWITSWGVSTRLIGTLIVVHGDDRGLRLPPAVAPVQVVVVPIYKSDAERERVLAAAAELSARWTGIRWKIDDRQEKSPGFKFSEWELKGVPLRVEIGPRDLERATVTLVRRDTGEKQTAESAGCNAEFLENLLAEIQGSLLQQARQWMQERTFTAASAQELQNLLTTVGGLVWAPWDGMEDTAEKAKAMTKATIRLVDPRMPLTHDRDFFSGQPAKTMALYARAY